jgi:hypothetical protein
MPKSSEPGRWSTQLAFYLAAVEAAVGLAPMYPGAPHKNFTTY